MNTSKFEYALTDGDVIQEKRFLTAQEAAQLNEAADMATAGTWWWALATPAKIVLRIPMSKKAAYVKAAKPGKLSEWCIRVLDEAAAKDESRKKLTHIDCDCPQCKQIDQYLLKRD